MQSYIEDAQVKKAQARVNETYGLFFPILEISMGQEKIEVLDDFSNVVASGTIGVEPINIRVTRDVPRYIIDSEMKLVFNLYSGGLHTAKVTEAISNVRRADAHKLVIRDTIKMEVATTYWELRKAQVNYQTALRTSNFAQEEAKWFAFEYREGRISEIDAASKRLELTDKEVVRDQAFQQLKDREAKYLSSLGLPAGMEETLMISELSDNPEQMNITPILSGRTEEKSPEMLALHADVEAASAGIRIARSELFPNADLYARYAAVGRDSDSAREALSDLRGNEWAVGFRMTWNLFNGFQSRNRIAQAHVLEEITILQLQKAREARSSGCSPSFLMKIK